MINAAQQPREPVNYDYYEQRARRLRSAAFWDLARALADSATRLVHKRDRAGLASGRTAAQCH